MSGGIRVTHLDSDPLFTGTHDGADSSSYLQSMGAMFKTLGAIPGLYVENETKGTSGVIHSSTDDVVYTNSGCLPFTLPFTLPMEWDNGDTYNIYKTDTKNAPISYEWTDVSRGWQAYPRDLVKGWMPEDRE